MAARTELDHPKRPYQPQGRRQQTGGPARNLLPDDVYTCSLDSSNQGSGYWLGSSPMMAPLVSSWAAAVSREAGPRPIHCPVCLTINRRRLDRAPKIEMGVSDPVSGFFTMGASGLPSTRQFTFCGDAVGGFAFQPFAGSSDVRR